MARIELPGHDVVGIRAENPSAFTLDGTNTWIVGRDPAWLIDPGPDLNAHLDALSAEIDTRGGLGAILLTHDHDDHAQAAPELARRFNPVPLAASRGETATIWLLDGDRIGPFEVIGTPGHAPDHLAFATDGGVVFTGDAVVGEGSVFIAPDPGALAGYLDALRKLRARRPSVLAPGHGPLVADADAKLAGYIEHRLAREQSLLAALADGLRTTDELVDRVWSDAPSILRPAAAVTLAAHLDKLEDDGCLPEGVQRPAWPVHWPDV